MAPMRGLREGSGPTRGEADRSGRPNVSDDVRSALETLRGAVDTARGRAALTTLEEEIEGGNASGKSERGFPGRSRGFAGNGARGEPQPA